MRALTFFTAIRIAAASALAVVSANLSAAAGPSFDCNRSGLNETEQAICAHPVLWQLDHRLSNAYTRFIEDPLAQGDTSADEVRQRERAWISERNACGAAVECIADAYRTQLSYLASILPAGAAPADGGPGTVSPTTVFPVPGTSAGGNVRSGPGVSYSKIGSLGTGAAITLLSNAGEVMDNYPWFEIRMPSGTVGYQLGALLCSNTQTVAGTSGTCMEDACLCSADFASVSRATQPCLVIDLSLSVGTPPSGTSQTAVPFSYTNMSGKTCALHGYPTIVLENEGADPLTGITQLSETGSAAFQPTDVAMVTLAPGDIAGFGVEFSAGTGSDCRRFERFAAIPAAPPTDPADNSSVSLPWSGDYCGPMTVVPIRDGAMSE